MKNTVSTLLLAVALTVLFAAAGRAEERREAYEVITVGAASYSNVVVQTKTKTDLYIKHATGFANLKVKDLDKSTQLQLGYLIEEPSSANAAPRMMAAPEITIDPRIEEWQEQIVWESQQVLEKVPPKVIYIALGIGFVLYLAFCNCCRLICTKTKYQPGPVLLVWFPVLRQIPLLKAAGMSGGWVLLNLLPPLLLIPYVVWCFKMVRAREKSALLGCLLLLPVTNVFAFLYLALSRGLNEEEEDQNPHIIRLYHDKKRSVA